MRDFSQDHRWLSINTATVRQQQGAEVPLARIIDQCAERGIRAISPWRDQVAAAGLDATARQLRAHGMELSGYCRGGFSRRRMRPACAPRSTTTAAPSTRPRH